MPPNSLRTIPWKVILGASVIVALIGGLFAIDQHYAKSADLKNLATNVKKDTTTSLKLAEAQTIQTFQTFQLQQMAMNKALQLQILNLQKESIDKEYWSLKRQMRLYPEDKELKLNYSEIVEQRRLLKEKIDKKINEK